MHVQVSLKLELAATASLTQMEEQNSRGRSAGHAKGFETSHQTLGGPEHDVPTVWPPATKIGGNGAPDDSNCFWACAGPAPTFSVPALPTSLVSSHRVVRRAERRNDQCAPARGGDARRVFVALSRGVQHAQEAQWRPHQCGRDPSADQSPRQAASPATASGGRTGLFGSSRGGPISAERRATDARGVGWGLGV